MMKVNVNKKTVTIISALVLIVTLIIGAFFIFGNNIMTDLSKDRDNEFLNKQLNLIEENLNDAGYTFDYLDSYTEGNWSNTIYTTNYNGDSYVVIEVYKNQVVAITGVTDEGIVSTDADIATSASVGILISKSEAKEIIENANNGKQYGDFGESIFLYGTDGYGQGVSVINSEFYNTPLDNETM